jgi:Transposase DDE domain group 1
MPTHCSATGMAFGRAGGRELVAAFDGGRVTSEAGALLLGATDQAIRLVDRFASCFRDGRHPAFVTHRVRSLVGQRIFGLALGYEDLVDHDDLRHDPVLGALLGRFEPDEAAPAPLAGKSTLNRLEHAPVDATARYHKIGHDAAAIEAVFVDLFLDAFRAKPPREIILDLDATDDPIHGHQEGRSFTASMTAIATCRSTSSAAGISWPPSCATPTSMRVLGLRRRWRASCGRSGPAGRG